MLPLSTKLRLSAFLWVALLLLLCTAHRGVAGDGVAGEDAAKAAATDDAGENATADVMREMQQSAIEKLQADWGYWGSAPARYSTWMNHSNRLVPIYTFGMTLDQLRSEGSVYSDADRLKKLYGIVPEGTLVEDAPYFDQTDIYRLQQQALAEGKTQVILVVFDGMDWNSTYNAALYKNGEVTYREGRGNGLFIQDYRGTTTDYGFCVTSPRLSGCKTDVDAQTVLGGDKPATGGYDPTRGGHEPSAKPAPHIDYLMGLDRTRPHTVADSAATATSMTTGVKTYNAAINFDVAGNRLETIAHALQRDRGFAIGVVTSVPISHATPGAAYAHNVSRDDYQDITRDMIGLPSVSHRSDPLPGVDVLIGCGWGESKSKSASQGSNFVPGREFYDVEDLRRVSLEEGGQYVVTQRTPGRSGAEVLSEATQKAIQGGHRLLGVFGAKNGHLPFATADGRFDPTLDARGGNTYTTEDITENPVLADMAVAALDVLERNKNGFWLMVEAGDVDWANHANSIDNSIGAVFSGDEAVKAVFDWIESRDAWQKTAVIVTADHGHYFNLTSPEAIAEAGKRTRQAAVSP
jgi:alkaline phosphatase